MGIPYEHMAQDLTAILVPQPPRGLNPDTIVNIVAQNVPPTAWVRLSPCLLYTSRCV